MTSSLYPSKNVCLLAVFLIGNGQLLATLGTAACQYTTTIGSGHSLTETMLVGTATVRGLECSFHNYVIIFSSTVGMRFGVQNYILFCK